MSNKKNGDLEEQSPPNKTDALIQEALSGLDAHKEEDGIAEFQGKDTDSQKVAQIDLQQYVNKETYMRLAADFDNFRKRALKERKEWERQGQEKVLHGFLDILDNLSRGVKQAEKETGALADGMRMVLSQCETWMTGLGFERIPTESQKFDPNIHDAVARVENAEAEDGDILEEVKRGYRWANSDRLLRPASVVVCKSENASEED